MVEFSPPPRLRFDCQSCGACCCNTARNVRDNYPDYVEVTRKDALFKDKEMRKLYAIRNERGEFHMRLTDDDEQRCVALGGRLGSDVGCTIYKLRPQGCKNVDAGDDECLKARARFGFTDEEHIIPRRGDEHDGDDEKNDEKNDEVNDEKNDEVNDEKNDEKNDEVNDEKYDEVNDEKYDEMNDEKNDDVV